MGVWRKKGSNKSRKEGVSKRVGQGDNESVCETKSLAYFKPKNIIS